ncbi:organic cation transporter protein-like isoform X2 [Varroa jacobsoni]|uniref:Major facilitator superfamily (MFS) profile domain-containing protein n=1 Tax=Varroa destructor TaxID=109461 RepID=A0A7M7KAW0_VARDE|nr:organic cation transporter protein-like isoform X2 [Varroa destructor]XP_022689931.1 organic cation transporter protein-like isoform X2 [Varroa jacobsoni]
MDDFLEKRGRWHWAVLALNAYAAVPHAWFVMAPSFMAPTKQNYTCFMMNSSNLSYSEAAAIESGLDNRCYLNVTGVVEKCTDWQFDTHEFKRTLQMDYHTVCDDDLMNSVHRSVLMAGLMVGNFVFSHLSDWFGRRLLIFVCVFFQVAFNLALIASPNFNWILALTFLAACGYGGMQNIPFAMTMESVGPSQRAFVTTCEEFGWIIGISIFPLFTYMLTDWRYLQISLVGPVLIILALCIWCDESPRWLVANGHIERARKLLLKIGQMNEIKDYVNKVEKILRGRSGKETVTSKASVVDLFREWSLGTNPHLNLFVSGLLELPLIPVCYITLKKLRRRVLYLFLYLPSLLASIGLACLPPGYTWIEMLLAMISKWASQVLFTLLVVHVAECFPTQVRALAVGSSLTMSRIGAIIAPFINRLDSRWRNVVCAVLVISGYLWSLVLPETSQENLPDTLVEVRLKLQDNTKTSTVSQPRAAMASTNENTGSLQTR